MPSHPREWLFIGAIALALALLRSARRVFWVFSLLVLPGTFAHEGCHLLLGLLLNAHPATFSLLPRREGQGWVMGSVTFANLRWYNCFFVGMAPLLLLPLAYALMVWRLRLVPAWSWQDGLAVYGIANLVYAALPSWQDLRAAGKSPVGWLLLAGGLGWAYRAYLDRPAHPSEAGAVSALATFAR